jgi:hypothetical protein
MAKSKHCEIRDGSKTWITVSVDQIIERRNKGEKAETMRCVECGGKVRAHKAGDWGEAHFEHLRKHPGCSLGSCFDNNRRPHPAAIK